MSGIHFNNARPSSAFRPRRLLTFTGLFLLLSAAGIYVIHDALAGHSFSFDRRLLSPGVLSALLALLAIYFTADGLRLYYALKALGQRVSMALIFRLVFINLFFSNVTPLATGGGIAQIWFLQRNGVPLGTATAAATVRTLLAIAFIFSLAPLAVLDLVPESLLAFDIAGLVYVGLLLAGYVAFFFLLIFRVRWLIGLIAVLVNRLHAWHVISIRRHQRWLFSSKREMLRFSRGFANYLRGQWHDVLLSVFFTAVFLLSLFSFPAVLLWALGHDPAWLTAIGLAAITTFIMYFSPTPGGAGIAEGVFGHLFIGLAGAGHLVLFTLVWRFLTIHLGMIIGVVATHHELTRGGGPACENAAASKPSST